MSRFSNALTRAIEETQPSQTAFAKACGMDLRHLNRYVRGTANCGAGNIQIIAQALPDAQRGEVVTAWLRDMVPDVANGLVSILSNATERTADLGIADGLTRDLSPRLHDAIRYLIAQAQQHTAISDLLIDLARALRDDKA
jgi:hypothetical protein